MDESDRYDEPGPLWPPDEIIDRPPDSDVPRAADPETRDRPEFRESGPTDEPLVFRPPIDSATDEGPRHAGRPVPLSRSPWSQPPRGAPGANPPRANPPRALPPAKPEPLAPPAAVVDRWTVDPDRMVPAPPPPADIASARTRLAALGMDRPSVGSTAPRPVPAARHSPAPDPVNNRGESEAPRYTFTGLRQITVANPSRGAGKTVATLLLAMVFGRQRVGSVLAWDRGVGGGGIPLATRAEAVFHERTAADLVRASDRLTRQELGRYVREQAGGTFDVLAAPTGADVFGDVRDVLARFYRLVIVDTGAESATEVDATDQLVITMSARGGSAEAAARMLDDLERSGRRHLVRRAVAIVTMPSSRRDVDVRAMTRHFSARTRTVLVAPFDRSVDGGGPIPYDGLSTATREAWSRIAAEVSQGL